MSDSTDLEKKNRADVLASASRSLTGVIPFIGPLLSEIVDNLIPNQRIDRLTKYVRELEDRLSSAERSVISQKLIDEESVLLVEEGFVHASRAVTDARRTYIAAIVANGLTDDQMKIGDSRYLLRLLAELNDSEIIWLRFYLNQEMDGDEVFRQKHSNVLAPAMAYIGAPMSDIDRSALQESYKDHLEGLGLVRSHLRIDRKSGLPEFDSSSGRPKVRSRSCTHLGRMLLTEIDLHENGS
jgi:hypothetical protein